MCSWDWVPWSGSWASRWRPGPGGTRAGPWPSAPTWSRAASDHAGPWTRALRDLAIVRYDALNEMTGQLSFSVALLNSAGDGVVLSSINSRSETRTYAKVVLGGAGTQPLAPEEEQAVRTARLGTGLRATAGPEAAGRGAAPRGSDVRMVTRR
jgi:hypothetical protein